MSEEANFYDEDSEGYENRPWTSCEEHGHRYQFDGQSEVFDACLDCGEKVEHD